MPPPERVTVREAKGVKRPARRLVELTDRIHVSLIEVRSFFPVDFDTYEMPVHDRCDVLVCEGVPGHCMTPGTGCVDYGYENGFVFLPGFFESGGSPWHPLDRLLGVLLKIETGFLCE